MLDLRARQSCLGLVWGLCEGIGSSLLYAGQGLDEHWVLESLSGIGLGN
jgi:hypothetical protein